MEVERDIPSADLGSAVLPYQPSWHCWENAQLRCISY